MCLKDNYLKCLLHLYAQEVIREVEGGSLLQASLDAANLKDKLSDKSKIIYLGFVNSRPIWLQKRSP